MVQHQATICEIYQEHTKPHSRGTHQLHNEGSSGTLQQPTVWSLGHISLCSQRSSSLSPLLKPKQLCVCICIYQSHCRLSGDSNTRWTQEFTSDYVDHAFQHCNSQAAACLMQGWHSGPVLVKSVEALHTTQSPAVTPTAALQSSVASCPEEKMKRLKWTMSWHVRHFVHHVTA